MSQFVHTASQLAQHPGGIGALGDLTFVSEVIIVERGNSREFFTLKGELLGVVKDDGQRVMRASTNDGLNALKTLAAAGAKSVQFRSHKELDRILDAGQLVRWPGQLYEAYGVALTAQDQSEVAKSKAKRKKKK